MAMYANIGGVNKLLAQTVAEMTAAGGGITHATVTSSITLTGGTLYLFFIGNIIITEEDDHAYAGCVGVYHSSTNALMNLSICPTDSDNLNWDCYYSSNGELTAYRNYRNSNYAYVNRSFTLGTFSGSKFTINDGYETTQLDFSYIVLK